MKNRHIAFVLFIFLTTQLFAGEVDFRKISWEEAKAAAKKENKYIFIDCMTDWCGWCKVMDRETFSKQEVADYMNKNFVSLKMEMETGFGIKMAMKYRVAAFPTALYFNPNGELVYRVGGYEPPLDFLKTVKGVADGTLKDSFKGISDKAELDFPAFYENACKKGKERKYPKEDEVVAFLDKQNDLFNEVSWSILSRFNSNKKYEEHFLNNIDKYRGLYGKSETEDLLNKILYTKIEKAVENKSEADFNTVLTLAEKLIKEDFDRSKVYMQITFYEGTESWKKYSEAIESLIKIKGELGAGETNSICWNLYEKCDDMAVLNKAVGWMKQTTEKDAQYMYLDTYAALLYKTKNYEEAEKTAKAAIEKGKANGENIKETEELLEKIRKAKSKK